MVAICCDWLDWGEREESEEKQDAKPFLQQLSPKFLALKWNNEKFFSKCKETAQF